MLNHQAPITLVRPPDVTRGQLLIEDHLPDNIKQIIL
jgi:hypothetical protein